MAARHRGPRTGKAAATSVAGICPLLWPLAAASLGGRPWEVQVEVACGWASSRDRWIPKMPVSASSAHRDAPAASVLGHLMCRKPWPQTASGARPLESCLCSQPNRRALPLASQSFTCATSRNSGQTLPRLLAEVGGLARGGQGEEVPRLRPGRTAGLRRQVAGGLLPLAGPVAAPSCRDRRWCRAASELTPTTPERRGRAQAKSERCGSG